MSSANEIVGRNLIKLRKARGLSQTGVGRASPVSQKTVSNIEQMGGAGSANLDTIEALADWFKVPLWQMLLDGMPGDPGTRRRLHDAVLAMLRMSDTSLHKVFDRIEEIEVLEAADTARRLG